MLKLRLLIYHKIRSYWPAVTSYIDLLVLNNARWKFSLIRRSISTLSAHDLGDPACPWGIPSHPDQSVSPMEISLCIVFSDTHFFCTGLVASEQRAAVFAPMVLCMRFCWQRSTTIKHSKDRLYWLLLCKTNEWSQVICSM